MLLNHMKFVWIGKKMCKCVLFLPLVSYIKWLLLSYIFARNHKILNLFQDSSLSLSSLYCIVSTLHFKNQLCRILKLKLCSWPSFERSFRVHKVFRFSQLYRHPQSKIFCLTIWLHNPLFVSQNGTRALLRRLEKYQC